jgi:hypothetical protein
MGISRSNNGILLSLQKNIEMRFSLNLIVIIALMGFIVACKTDPKVANTATTMGKAAPNENPNGVYLDYNIQDVGAIPRDIPKTVTVVIHNNKPDSIQITGTPTTCDCMTIGLQKKSSHQEIQPRCKSHTMPVSRDYSRKTFM